MAVSSMTGFVRAAGSNGLERRAEDSSATIEQRLEAARHEIERWRGYHYVIVDDDLQRAPGRSPDPLDERGRRG